jgi:hypothetical protein
MFLASVIVVFAIYILPVLPGVPRSQAELKFSVIDRVGDPMVCTGWGVPNPPFTPDTEYPRIVADLPTYLAILRHERLPPTLLSQPQVATVYRAWLKLNAVVLTWRDGYYNFKLYPGPWPSEQLENDTIGRVDLFGRVYDVREGPDMGACPICLAKMTLIATPIGPVPITRLAAGMHVWSVDSSGRPVEAIVMRVAARNDVAGSELVHVALADGRNLTASAPHRLADGRPIGSLQAGDPVAGVRVVAVDLVPDLGGSTYDLLPSGDTGEYWADGILLQSTLLK